MKRTAFLYSIVALIVIFIFSSCSKDENLDWKYLNESWLEQHKNDEHWVTESNGLQYKINYAGAENDATPSSVSYVIIERCCLFINGDTLYTQNYDSDYLTKYPLGVQQILKKMKINADYEIRIPYHLAYGDEGIENTVPPYTTLIYNLKLRSFLNTAP